ncbi:MAG: hypothetical protein U0234_25935 [Sandaracinus sp.]
MERTSATLTGSHATAHLRALAVTLVTLALHGCGGNVVASDAGHETDAAPPDRDAAQAPSDGGLDAELSDAATSASDASSDAAQALDASTSAEVDTCAHLARLAPCGPASEDAAVCLEGLLQTRSQSAGCEPEYAAWIACVSALTSCPSGSGALCPTEYSALGTCISH